MAIAVVLGMAFIAFLNSHNEVLNLSTSLENLSLSDWQ